MNRLVTRGVIVCILCGMWSMSTFAQLYRTYNGVGNNIQNPDWGSQYADLERISGATFADNLSAPAAPERVNPRTVSNIMFSQEASIFEKKELSDYVWVFGQFIDHDITLTTGNHAEGLLIEVPKCDPHFDPNCTGLARIPMNRSNAKAGTGIENARQYENEITAFVDGSGIYGSTEERANWLRTFEGGKLKSSNFDLLPFNTTTGEFNDGFDAFAPFMDNAGINTKLFVAGDIRANENSLLTSMHTVFMREHNRWCDMLTEQNPTYDDETLYQEARRRVIAILQSITYEEWLPTMGVYIPQYGGYSANVNPNIFIEFSTAAFRIGHTMLSGSLKMMDDNCQDVNDGQINLREIFFEPIKLIEYQGVEPFLKGMSAQKMQELDCKVVDDVRNFLFGPPGSGFGMDLAAINIMRGREMGLADFNTIRSMVGLPKYNSFEEICSDPTVSNQLSQLYKTVDNIDAWVGMLSEDHTAEGIMGHTMSELLKKQFQAIRNGDRYYFENNQFSEEEINEFKNTRLADVVMRNTSLRFMQENLFIAKPSCEHAAIDIAQGKLNAKLYSNPVGSSCKLGVYTYTETTADITITNVLGQTVFLDRLSLLEGVNLFERNVDFLRSGRYILSVRTPEGYRKQISFIKI